MAEMTVLYMKDVGPGLDFYEVDDANYKLALVMRRHVFWDRNPRIPGPKTGSGRIVDISYSDWPWHNSINVKLFGWTRIEK